MSFHRDFPKTSWLKNVGNAVPSQKATGNESFSGALLTAVSQASNVPRVWILWDAIQKELSMLMECSNVNLIMLNKVKCNVLHPGQYQYRLGNGWIGTGEGLGNTGGCKTGHMPAMCAYRPEKQTQPCLPNESCGLLWSSLHKEHMGLLEQVQRRVTKMVRGLELSPSYEEMLRELELFSLGERRLWSSQSSLLIRKKDRK
ncbi:hypothetical protein TURU_018680 [Turdus rufiventris]|nr:hypothetical protein TURU_018680 [Turdus rufiventris]